MSSPKTATATSAAAVDLSARRRLLYLALWLALVLDLVWLSPPPSPDQGTWVLETLRGDWAGKNPTTVALFNLMGLWPLAFGVRLRREVAAWPFVLASMAIGAFALLPYLLWRPAPPPPPRLLTMGPWLRRLGHPLVWLALSLAALSLVVWGLLAGDLSAHAYATASEQLVQVMSLDCVALAIAFGALGRARPLFSTSA